MFGVVLAKVWRSPVGYVTGSVSSDLAIRNKSASWVAVCMRATRQHCTISFRPYPATPFAFCIMIGSSANIDLHISS